MKTLIICLLFSFSAYAQKPVKIAVLDTGFDLKSDWEDASEFGLKKPVLCKKGHKDFTGTSIQDTHGHGTHVAGIIAKYAKKKYCLVILKTHDSTSLSQDETYRAINHAIKIGVDVISYSGGGSSFILKEYLAVKKALDAGILLVTAAGNDNERHDYQIHSVKIMIKSNKRHDYKIKYINRRTLAITSKRQKGYYPAAYDSRIISVKSYNNSERHGFSNYGDAYGYQDNGENVLSLLPNNVYGKMSGTSMATPKKTAQIINNWDF